MQPACYYRHVSWSVKGALYWMVMNGFLNSSQANWRNLSCHVFSKGIQSPGILDSSVDRWVVPWPRSLLFWFLFVVVRWWRLCGRLKRPADTSRIVLWSEAAFLSIVSGLFFNLRGFYILVFACSSAHVTWFIFQGLLLIYLSVSHNFKGFIDKEFFHSDSPRG